MHDTTSTKIGVCKEFAKSSYNTKENGPHLERNQVKHGHFQFLFRITTVNFCPTGSPKPTLWSSFFCSRCLQFLHFIFHHYHELQHSCDILPALYFQKTSSKTLNIKIVFEIFLSLMTDSHPQFQYSTWLAGLSPRLPQEEQSKD